MAEIDTRLTHPRRRATDNNRAPVLPDLAPADVTTEMLDEIAWRVAEQMRKDSEAAAHGAIEQTGLRPGKILMIRYKMPALPWPLRLLQRRSRKKQHPLTTARMRA